MEDDAFNQGYYNAYWLVELPVNPYDETDYRFVEWNNGWACADEEAILNKQRTIDYGTDTRTN